MAGNSKHLATLGLLAELDNFCREGIWEEKSDCAGSSESFPVNIHVSHCYIIWYDVHPLVVTEVPQGQAGMCKLLYKTKLHEAGELVVSATNVSPPACRRSCRCALCVAYHVHIGLQTSRPDQQTGGV